MKIFLALILLTTSLMGAAALPYVPGCPLHDSCVRALKQEQRQRQREQRQRESPEAPQNEDDAEDGEDEEGVEKPPIKKPIGLILGFQMDIGDWNDKRNDYINLRPSVAYLNGFGNFDFFASLFYTLSLDDPGLSPVGRGETLKTMSRGGIEVNVGYTFDLGERFTLAPEIDNQLQFDFMPDANSLYSNGEYLSYAVLEPALRFGCDLEVGDLVVANSFPFAYAGDMALDYTITATFTALLGFSVTVACQLWNLWVDPDSEYGRTNPGFQYGETELTLNYWRGPFFSALTMTADGGFEKFSIEPYVSYRIKKVSVFAGIIFSNLGAERTDEEIRLNAIQGKRDVSGVIPSIGVKLRL